MTPPDDTETTRPPALIKLPVKAHALPLGDWVWFIVDADFNNVAQTYPSGDEAKCREMVRLINLSHQSPEP
jgi:hypothetical protein